MKIIKLNGRWALQKSGEKSVISAIVPGDVYRDLLNAKRISDPFYRDTENGLHWIGEYDWKYSREFRVSATMLKHERILLQCKGLDTFAAISINGHKLATSDNMFRTWEWDIKPLLKLGLNQIEILFTSTIPYITKKDKQRSLPDWNKTKHAWVRKEPCNYGWDWGIKAVTCGIWRDIALVGFNSARLSDILIKQDHSSKDHVVLSVGLTAEILQEERLLANIKVIRKNKIVAEQSGKLSRGKCNVDVCINAPELWWPNNMGNQPLYTVIVELLNANGDVIDSITKRIGVRTLHLDRHKDKWGESFQFVVNGVPFFAKGANWIPGDGILSRMTQQRYRKLVEDAASANMNMLRVWGGGIYEDDSFYDACDELGICVWQDFMFACSAYPTFDKKFMENVKVEATDNIMRLRHHPSIALWCGNNELEQGLVGEKWTNRTMSWKDYKKLFDDLLPAVICELDPQRDYWPCSPHSPTGDRKDYNNQDCGDAHLWDVWFANKPFEWYRTCQHRFNSEFGFQSFPEPKTVRSYTIPKDRNITSRIVEHHQRSAVGSGVIIAHMMEWFLMPEGFDNTLWLSQILQGMAIKYACEHWRRCMPRGMGTLYWQLNDMWPVTSWSSIDYFGRWKALHYMARKFFAPILISGVEDSNKGTVEIHVTSDVLKPLPGTVRWRVTDLAGKRILAGRKNIVTPSNGNKMVEKLQIKKNLAVYEPRDLLVWMELSVKGHPVEQETIFFVRPKQLELVAKPGIQTSIAGLNDGSFAVTLKTKAPALWVWLELDNMDADLSDNFFHIRPGKNKVVLLKPHKKILLKDIRKRLVVRSLVDTVKKD